MRPLAHVIAILERTPATLEAMLAGLPAALTDASYGPGTFSAFDILAHLVHGERVDWMPRAEQILAGRGDVPFEAYVIEASRAVGEGKALAELVGEFASARRENLARLAALGLTPEQLALTGTHPALGRVTLANLLAAWAAHDLHHTAQACKALVFQFADDVGAWEAYIGLVVQARRAGSR